MRTVACWGIYSKPSAGNTRACRGWQNSFLVWHVKSRTKEPGSPRIECTLKSRPGLAEWVVSREDSIEGNQRIPVYGKSTPELAQYLLSETIVKQSRALPQTLTSLATAVADGAAASQSCLLPPTLACRGPLVCSPPLLPFQGALPLPSLPKTWLRACCPRNKATRSSCSIFPNPRRNPVTAMA